MKFYLRRAVAALFVVASGVSSVSNAALVDRGGGLIYDTDLNITWLADANYAMTSGFDADGAMTWSTAMTWAADLSYGGYTDWRLPATVQPDATCGDQSGGDSFGYNCTGSEMGHLFYTELGGVARTSIATTHNANYNLFQNVQSSYYWSGTLYAPDTGLAWYFSFYNGVQTAHLKNHNGYAWAVRPGDVAAVPLPATAWLFGSGLVGLVGRARLQ